MERVQMMMGIDAKKEDTTMLSAPTLPSYSVMPATPSPDTEIKMEDYDDDDSESVGTAMRSLHTESDSRDSPNTSLTSMSTTSSTVDTNSATTPKKVVETNAKEPSSPFLYTKASGTFRARSSIPSRLAPAEYAKQCIAAAKSSRLDPFALHQDEHELLQDKLCQLHVTVYLNIRNGILRLWVRNPNVAISLEEAIGCVKDERWTRLACFAYEWLLRRGYINFGCVEPVQGVRPNKGRKSDSSRKTIVVVGGGMAGLSSARQLTNLFQHFPDHSMPRIIVLEGRRRIGGRIYSHPLTSMMSASLKPDQRPTAEMGAHIIIGFQHGNPMDTIVRGQLALSYHSLTDRSTLYDIDGSPVNENNDTMMNQLYDDIVNRTGQYRNPSKIKKTAEGDKMLVESGRDPPEEASITIRQHEEATASGTIDQILPKKSRRRGAGHKAAKLDKPAEEVDTEMVDQTQLPAAQAAQKFGFLLRKNTDMNETLDLDYLASREHQSLGTLMNEGVKQYQKFLELRPFALRLLNWHFANTEYANAADVDRLNLSSWDLDTAYEFKGEHAQVVGGYQQVPRAIWRYPDALDVRTNKAVASIQYAKSSNSNKATVICEDGERIQADRIVFSAPLGVLKDQSIQFSPPLPDWKQGSISRLGFGLLNKLVLVFERPFWDVERDMFGLLRAPKSGPGFEQADYKAGRGQFYLFWNTIETSGLPVLIALISGEAAYDAERTPDQVLVSQGMEQLRNIYGKDNVPDPIETIVTRWASDRFARGTYSFVATEAAPDDFDVMAKPVDNLFFAGEATSRAYPATVHGAYLSGLRAANEVFESIVGPIQIPPTLVPAASKNRSQPIDLVPMDTHMAQGQKRKGDPILPAGTLTRPVKEKDETLQKTWEEIMWVRIYGDLGPPPVVPPKLNTNPFLAYQNEHWNAVKERVVATRKASKGKSAKTERDAVRVELGKMWAALSEEDKSPFTDEVRRNRESNEKALAEWQAKAAEWDRKTWEVKAEWIKEGNGFEEFCKRKREEDALMDGMVQ